MYQALAQYTHIISTQTKALLHSNIINLNKTQRSAFRTINLHVEKLARTVASLETAQGHGLPSYLVKQLDNLVAPIQRYAELLNTAWVGQLNHDQALHVEIILNSALDLAQLLNRQATDNQIRA
jgi:hypothetical protein